MNNRDNSSYIISHRKFSQPIDHNQPSEETLHQRVSILRPKKSKKKSPVFFHLGEEQALEDENLILLYDSYGKQQDIIYIHAEHRGYGTSISKSLDQTKPDYVKIDQALSDYHNIIKELKKEFIGPWMGVGYSYGGGLIINYAAEYPSDFDIILSSSGVIEWPFMMDDYDKQMRINFGIELYDSLANMMDELEPKELFDQNWYEREFLIACLHGIAQKEEFKRFQKTLLKLTKKSTGNLLEQLHKIDNNFAERQAHYYAVSNSKEKLTRNEALTKNFSWRVWRYQQCYETGVFEVSENDNGIFKRTYDDFIEEGTKLFGEDPPAAKNKGWAPHSMLKKIEIPLVYVCGGKDPWHGLGLEKDYELKKGKYYYYPNARHCPEKDKIQRGKEVLDAMLEYIT